MTTRTLEGVGEELIECYLCHKVLNGLSLWVTEDGTMCEECHALDMFEPEEKGEQ